MSIVLERAYQECSEDKNIIGIAVFGSFVTGGISEESDLDLLIIRSDDAKFEKTEREAQGVSLELNVWPRSTFEKSFTPVGTDLGQDGFVFEVMRTCRILYDPSGLLAKWKEYAETHTIPEERLAPILRMGLERLDRAKKFLDGGQLEASELEIRLASEHAVEIALVRRNIMKFTVPKVYMPPLRSELSDLYAFFKELQCLKVISRGSVQDAIDSVQKWREGCLSEIQLSGREDWFTDQVMWGGAARGAATELRNAIDCLRSGDLEAALMQARYSAILVMSPLELLVFGTKSRPSERLAKLIKSGHPYVEVLRKVMSFRTDKGDVRRLIPETKDFLR